MCICCSKFFKAEVYETIKVNYFILLQKYPPFRKPFLQNLQYSLFSILTLKQLRIYLILLELKQSRDSYRRGKRNRNKGKTVSVPSSKKNYV